MKNLARMYRAGGMPLTPKAPAPSKSPALPKSDEMLNEEMMPDILNQPETSADKKQDEADKKAPGMDADQPKKPAKPPVKKAASGGVMYARGAKVKSASSRADGIAERGHTKGKMC